MSLVPGFDLLTLFEPCDGKNGVTMDAAAIGIPERSWIVTNHHFRSFLCILLSVVQELKKPNDVIPLLAKIYKKTND